MNHRQALIDVIVLIANDLGHKVSPLLTMMAYVWDPEAKNIHFDADRSFESADFHDGQWFSSVYKFIELRVQFYNEEKPGIEVCCRLDN